MHFRDYLEHLKRKPAHIKQRIAFGSATAVTGLVFAVWLTGLVTSDALALTPSDPEVSESLAEAHAQTSEGFSELLGAASAFTSAVSGDGITVVDAGASSTLPAAAPEDTRTVIPF